MQLYLHDMSEFTNEAPNESGLYVSKYLDLYWTDSDRFPYIILENQKPIGFALVRELDLNSFSIAEFFIIKHARSKGYGITAAKEIFNKHDGLWHVAQIEENIPAQRFWRKVISSYTNGDYEEKWSGSSPKGPLQTFKTKDLTN